MNNSILSKLKLIVVLAGLATGLMGCSNADRGLNVRSSGGGSIVNSGNTGAGIDTTSCSTATTTVGKIYSATASANFEAQVKAFVSATLDPSALGTVSGDINAKTGIDFTGALSFDSSGNLLPSNSNITIKIFDSYVGQIVDGQPVQPYLIQFKAASSGRLDLNTRQFQVTFSDSYGDIILQGQYDNSLAQGTVTFQNKVAVSGYTAASGTLGSFKIYTCAFIK